MYVNTSIIYIHCVYVYIYISPFLIYNILTSRSSTVTSPIVDLLRQRQRLQQVQRLPLQQRRQQRRVRRTAQGDEDSQGGLPGRCRGRYCTIFLAIFWGDIPLHSPFISLIYGRYLHFRILKFPLKQAEMVMMIDQV